nr:hypothetical protein Iba_chr11dCG1220 [Ipomoea batatas]
MQLCRTDDSIVSLSRQNHILILRPRVQLIREPRLPIFCKCHNQRFIGDDCWLFASFHHSLEDLDGSRCLGGLGTGNEDSIPFSAARFESFLFHLIEQPNTPSPYPSFSSCTEQNVEMRNYEFIRHPLPHHLITYPNCEILELGKLGLPILISTLSYIALSILVPYLHKEFHGPNAIFKPPECSDNDFHLDPQICALRKQALKPPFPARSNLSTNPLLEIELEHKPTSNPFQESLFRGQTPKACIIMNTETQPRADSTAKNTEYILPPQNSSFKTDEFIALKSRKGLQFGAFLLVV